jgi:serine/threonine protein kinase
LTPEDAVTGAIRGRRLAHFELIQPIGVGGMAAVLLARDTQLDRRVALKILPPEMAKDAENVQRFHHEARSAARLDHENIARVFFCGDDQQLHFIAFEFVEGENLRVLLERRGRLPVEEAIHYVLQVAAGLAHAARRGVVHRDIKPSNIIITPSGRAKLVDMGLARSLEPQHDLGLTQSGVTLGTFDYISPEQALEPRDADVRSDIYSLGCTLYHMLTGHPPVPEGTAAKKLHHHQHVKPPDPRQLVRDLPDEVAIILDRMMAKLPRDRYQSPEQLVHHLLLAAKKLGASPDVPEGVLTMEAALPTPPGTRPLLVAGLAALTVIVLVFILGQSPPDANSNRNGPFVEKVLDGANAKDTPGHGDSTAKTPGDKDSSKDKGPVKPPEKRVVFDKADGTRADLLAWLKENADADEMEIVLAHDLDLSGEPGLLVKAKRVTIKGRDEGTRPTLRLTYHLHSAQNPQAALTIEGAETTTLRGLRVIVDGCASEAEMVGVLIKGGQKHLIEQCEFLQAQPSFHATKRLASVVVDAWAGQPNLTLRGCCFLGYQKLETESTGGQESPRVVLHDANYGGQDAVVRRGPVKIEAQNCAWGPHRAAFRLEGLAGKQQPVVLRHCSVAAATPSAVFHLYEGATAALDVEDSLFARLGNVPMDAMPEADAPVLAVFIQEPRGTSNALTYTGNRNRFYKLDAYSWSPGESRLTGWNEFLAKFSDGPTRDRDRCRELDRAPWKDDPLKRLDKQENIVAAFQLDTGRADLLVDDAERPTLVGVESLLGTALLGPDKKPGPLARRELVVNPKENDSARGIYPSLDQALLAAQPGDVILLQVNGELAVKPILLEKESLDLTIRPDADYHPRLTLGETLQQDTALFRLQSGKLRLEKLEFVLKPERDEFTAQSVAALAGNGQCEFKDCVITLDRNGRAIPLAVVSVAANGGVMKIDSSSGPTAPRVSFEQCFVRGEGDLIWSRTSRPFDLEAKHTLAALTGSLLNVETKEENAAASGPKVAMRLRRVTTYLGGNLIRLQVGKDLKALVPMDCKTSYCLFVPPATGRALIHLDGPEISDDKFGEKLKWEGDANAYGNFNPLFDQQQSDTSVMSRFTMNLDKWKTFCGETTSKFTGVKLATGPAADKDPFTQMKPSQFKPAASDLSGTGADLEALSKLLPESEAK